jgi:hypothetical protein
LGEETRQKESIKLKGRQYLRAANRYLMRVPSIKLKLLENFHSMICESRILYGVRKRDQILSINFRRFCNRVIGSPRNTAKGAAEWELGRESRKGRILCSVVKYWYRTLLMEKDELLNCSYEW